MWRRNLSGPTRQQCRRKHWWSVNKSCRTCAKCLALNSSARTCSSPLRQTMSTWIWATSTRSWRAGSTKHCSNVWPTSETCSPKSLLSWKTTRMCPISRGRYTRYSSKWSRKWSCSSIASSRLGQPLGALRVGLNRKRWERQVMSSLRYKKSRLNNRIVGSNNRQSSQPPKPKRSRLFSSNPSHPRSLNRLHSLHPKCQFSNPLSHRTSWTDRCQCKRDRHWAGTFSCWEQSNC